MSAATDWTLWSKCPVCDSKVGAPCIYQPIGQLSYGTSKQTLDRHANVGKPMKRPHAKRKLKTKPYVRPFYGPKPAVAAVKQFDQMEYEQMREWLKKNARILWEVW